jgi:phosphoenolpyruvate carboxykinase (ATP)
MMAVDKMSSTHSKVHYNLPASELINMALTRGEGVLASNQALVVNTGPRTGRSPKDRFIVRDAVTENTVDWNNINQGLSQEKFSALWERAQAHIATKDVQFISDYSVAADNTYALPVKVISELAWHNLFTQNLFIRKAINNPAIEWTILSVPSLATDPARDGVNSDAAVILNFSERRILICGTYYAGEMKKAMFSVLNFLLPQHDVLPMHCSANVGKDGNTTLFFGLSGTGKTTLSADPERFLIGDDEHGWSKEAVFNFEGGCYAKCIDLSQKNEPVIWNAIRSGTVLENVVIDPDTKTPDYNNTSLTQNTRAAYPLEFIPVRTEENRAGVPNAVVFLTCDLYGVLPPVSRLTKEQAAYYFLSGYTALVGSTEVGQGTGIKPTFSTCFGAPFFPRPPKVYAHLLMKRLEEDNADVYLVNTGWNGGAHGAGGTRFSIPTTRAVVRAVVNGDLRNATYEKLPGFHFEIPTAIKDVDSKLLNPLTAWPDKAEHDRNAKLLMQQFVDNFKKFDVSDAIRQAGPQLND